MCQTFQILSASDTSALPRLVGESDPWVKNNPNSRSFLVEVMLATYEARTSQTEAVNAMPLYPTEAILWDDNQVPDVHYTGGLLVGSPVPVLPNADKLVMSLRYIQVCQKHALDDS